MAQFYSIDRANERLGSVRELLLLLRSQRGELVRLRDRYLAATGGIGGDDTRLSEAHAEHRGGGTGDRTRSIVDLDEGHLLKLRIKGVVDQMGASVARIDGWGITLRDIDTGLIDFPALVNGRQVWLCWRLGEDSVEWWHELDAGVAGRRRIVDLE